MKYLLALSVAFNVYFAYNLHKESDNQPYYDKATLFCLKSGVLVLAFDTEGNAGIVCKDGKAAVVDKELKLEDLGLETRDI
jgi:hypothetical protein